MERIRPLISSYEDPIDFVKDMIFYLKKTEAGFSVMNASKKLRRVSPGLVSLIIQRKRKLVFDRVDDFADLLRLSFKEKLYFKQWIERINSPNKLEIEVKGDKKTAYLRRKEVSTYLIKDWINVYVKDCFLLPEVQVKSELIYVLLSHLASPNRIKQSFEFLLREGYLKTQLDGKIVVETHLAVMDTNIPSQKIRNFHKGALKMAYNAIEEFSPNERYANALILTLNKNSYQDLISLIQEFAEKLKEFSEKPNQEGERLYQFIFNLSPTGGSNVQG